MIGPLSGSGMDRFSRQCRVDVESLSFGTAGFYLLDDTNQETAPRAPETPMLLGGRLLRNIEAILNYGDNLFIFKDGQGKVKFLPLMRTRSGHLVVDMCEPSVSLTCFSEQMRREYGVRLPSSQEDVKQVFGVPGLGSKGSRDFQYPTPGTNPWIEFRSILDFPDFPMGGGGLRPPPDSSSF